MIIPFFLHTSAAPDRRSWPGKGSATYCTMRELGKRRSAGLVLTVVPSLLFRVFKTIKGIWTSSNGQAIRFGEGSKCGWTLDKAGKRDTFLDNIPPRQKANRPTYSTWAHLVAAGSKAVSFTER